MRVVVVGASGNVGTSTLAALGDAPAVEEIVALARRRPQLELPKANVDGSRRVFAAVAEAKVPALVYASSVGAYSKGPKDRAVDESWPTDGIVGSYYSRQKAATERQLDEFEAANPSVRVVRLRPGLI